MQREKHTFLSKKVSTMVKKKTNAILDTNYVDFLQFYRYFIPQAELEEAFINIIHKPIDFSIDFSYRRKTFHIDLRLRILGHMVIGLKQVRVPVWT